MFICNRAHLGFIDETLIPGHFSLLPRGLGTRLSFTTNCILSVSFLLVVSFRNCFLANESSVGV